MNNIFNTIATLLTVLVMVNPVMAIEDLNAIRLIDGGLGDGEARGYTVYCPPPHRQGTRGNVAHYYKTGEICINKPGVAKEECFKSNDIDAAAIKVCSQ